jgi:hypothetical protein
VRRRTLVVLLCATAALGGCADPGRGTDASGPTEVVESTPTPRRPGPTELAPVDRPPGDGPGTGLLPQGGAVERAVLDLATALGVPLEEVSVVAVQEVTWRDGSLGCPEPGRTYTDVVVDGLRIELEVGGSTYWYHSGGDRDPFRCENARLPAGDG